MSDWAKAELHRHQRVLMAPSLEEQIGADHGIRLLDGMLAQMDWSKWEAAYERAHAGRPPLHPRLMAGAILYGLLKAVRSTRGLEEATAMRLDFRWLLEGRRVDHSTFAEFLNRFGSQIGELFKALNRRAAVLRKATLEEILIDGTRLRADSDRHGARTAEVLEKRLAGLEQQIGQALLELGQQGEAPIPEQAPRAELERRLALLDAQRQKISKALEVARQRDRRKRAKDGKGACAVRVPVSDPDAHLMPNKEGGYAPNYTPVAAVEPTLGLIVGAEIAEGNAEAESVAALMVQVRETAGDLPRRALFDDGFASGQNLRQLAAEGVDVYAPLGANAGANPAERPDPSVPVAPEARKDLPVRGGQLDRAAFLHDASKDIYHCPMGRSMSPVRTLKRKAPDGSIITVVEYRCNHCGGCPLAAVCLAKGAKARTLSRDQYEPLREAVRARMRTEAGSATYARRAPVAEGVFAHLKSAMGIRRFMRRGTAKVRADWFWICTAYNLKKLIRAASQKPAPGQASVLPLPCTSLLRDRWLPLLRATIRLPSIPSSLWRLLALQSPIEFAHEL